MTVKLQVDYKQAKGRFIFLEGREIIAEQMREQLCKFSYIPTGYVLSSLVLELNYRVCFLQDDGSYGFDIFKTQIFNKLNYFMCQV